MVFAGSVSVVASFVVGNILMAGRVLGNFGLGFVAENSGLLLWLGIAAAVVGGIVVATSNVDVETE